MTFRKRNTRGKTLLQKGFPPRPPFRKLLNSCGVTISRRHDRFSAHDLMQHILEFFPEVLEGGFVARKSPPGYVEYKKQSISNIGFVFWPHGGTWK
jgi:hypothetical protein